MRRKPTQPRFILDRVAVGKFAARAARQVVGYAEIEHLFIGKNQAVRTGLAIEQSRCRAEVLVVGVAAGLGALIVRQRHEIDVVIGHLNGRLQGRRARRIGMHGPVLNVVAQVIDKFPGDGIGDAHLFPPGVEGDDVIDRRLPLRHLLVCGVALG